MQSFLCHFGSDSTITIFIHFVGKLVSGKLELQRLIWEGEVEKRNKSAISNFSSNLSRAPKTTLDC